VTTPRLRPELHATPAEEAGVRFFDVSDPRSGAKMRLYDFEWLLAAQMDGYRSLEEIARWAQGELKLSLSAANLSAYADKLGELGFFAPADSVQSTPKLPTATNVGPTITPLPPPAPGTDIDVDDDIPLELAEPNQDGITTVQQAALPPREHAPENEFDNAPTTAKHNAAFEERAQQRAAASRPLPKLPTEATEASPPPAKSSSGSVFALLFVILAVGGVVAYVTWFAPGGAKVAVKPAAITTTTTLYPGGPVKLGQAPPQKLSFAEAGKVTDVVAAGTEVKAGQALATLDSFPKVEKELADVKDRLGFYQKQLEAAGAKGDVTGQKSAEEKVTEKKKIATDLEAHAAKLRLVASGPGVVSKVSVAAGADAKPGDPAVEFTDKRVVAIFHAPTAADLKVGSAVTVQSLGGVAAPGTVVAHEGEVVTVEVGESAPLKAGTDVDLVQSKLEGVVEVPASAIASKAGADTVFVLAGGQVHAHNVKIAERSGPKVYLSSGLAAGDEVVVSGVDALKDGDKATAAQ
jgi:hypothetical protein